MTSEESRYLTTEERERFAETFCQSPITTEEEERDLLGRLFVKSARALLEAADAEPGTPAAAYAQRSASLALLEYQLAWTMVSLEEAMDRIAALENPPPPASPALRQYRIVRGHLHLVPEPDENAA